MSEEKDPKEAPSEEPLPSPKWEYKTEFAIHTKMKEVVLKTMDVTTAELDILKSKLDKLTYGS